MKVILFILLFSCSAFAQDDQGVGPNIINGINAEVESLREILREDAGIQNPKLDADPDIQKFLQLFKAYRITYYRMKKTLDPVIDNELRGELTLAMRRAIGYDFYSDPNQGLETLREELQRISEDKINPRIMAKAAREVYTRPTVDYTNYKPVEEPKYKESKQELPKSLPDRVIDIQKLMTKYESVLDKRIKNVEKNLSQLTSGVKTYVTPNDIESGLIDLHYGNLSDHPVPKGSVPKAYIKEEVLSYSILARERLHLEYLRKNLDDQKRAITIFNKVDKLGDVPRAHDFLNDLEADVASNYNIEKKTLSRENRRIWLGDKFSVGNIESSVYMFIALGAKDIIHFYTGGRIMGDHGAKRYGNFTNKTFWEYVQKTYGGNLGIPVSFGAFIFGPMLVRAMPEPQFVKQMTLTLDAYGLGVVGTKVNGLFLGALGLAVGMKFAELAGDIYAFRAELSPLLHGDDNGNLEKYYVTPEIVKKLEEEYKKIHSLAMQYYLKKDITSSQAWSQIASSTLTFTMAEMSWSAMKYPFSFIKPPKSYKLNSFNDFIKKKTGARCTDFHTEVLKDMEAKISKQTKMSENKLYYFWQRIPVTASKAIADGTMIFLLNDYFESHMPFLMPGKEYEEEMGKLLVAMEQSELEAFYDYLSILPDFKSEAISRKIKNEEIQKREYEYLDYVYSKFGGLYFLRDAVSYLEDKNNTWAPNCLLEKTNADDVKAFLYGLFDAVGDPYNSDSKLKTLMVSCGGTTTVVHEGKELINSQENIKATTERIESLKADTNVQKELGGKLTKNIPVNVLVEGAMNSQTISLYTSAYESRLKKGVWDKGAKDLLSGAFEEFKNIIRRSAKKQGVKNDIEGKLKVFDDELAWSDKVANEAINEPVCDLKPLLSGMNLKFTGKEPYANEFKRLMCLFLHIYPKYMPNSDTGANGYEHKSNFLYNVAEGLYYKLVQKCGGNDLKVAVGDMFSATHYLAFDTNYHNIGLAVGTFKYLKLHDTHVEDFDVKLRKGKWDKKAEEELANYLREGNVYDSLYNWSRGLADDAINQPLCELYYNKPGTPLLPKLKVELEEKGECAESLKRMMCLFFGVYPKYFTGKTKDEKDFGYKQDIAFAVAEGLFSRLRDTCKGNDYWAAMSDLYPVRWYSHMTGDTGSICMDTFLHLREVFGNKLGLHYDESSGNDAFRTDPNVPKQYRHRDLSPEKDTNTNK